MWWSVATWSPGASPIRNLICGQRSFWGSPPAIVWSSRTLPPASVPEKPPAAPCWAIPAVLSVRTSLRQISPFLIFIFTNRSHFFRIFLRSEFMTKQTKPIQIGLVCFAFKLLRSVQETRHRSSVSPIRRRAMISLHDGSFGIAQGCRPGNEGKAPLGPAHLMQKRALIAMQYSALHHRTWKTPTVQKPCRNRALTLR